MECPDRIREDPSPRQNSSHMATGCPTDRLQASLHGHPHHNEEQDCQSFPLHVPVGCSPPLDSAHETDSIPARNAGTAAPKKYLRNLDMSPCDYLYTGPKHAHAL